MQLTDNILRVGVSALFLWCLIGCTVGPDFNEPKLYDSKQIQKALELQPTKIETKKSYLIFDDKVLNKLLGMAVENSPSVKAAVTRVKQARLSVKIAEVQGLPTLDAAGQYQYVKESRNIGLAFNEDVYQVGLDASWEIDIFGGIRRRTEAAVADAYATIANLDNVYVSLTSQVALAYLGLRQGQSQEALTRQTLALQQKTYGETQNLWNAGLVSQDELNSAQMQVQSTKSSLAQIETQIEQSKNQLALLTGQLPKSLDALLVPQKNNLVARPFDFNINRFYQLPATVLEDRPDVKSSVYALMAQNAQVGAAIADLYPKISLSGMLGFESLHLDKLFNHKSYTYSYTPGFSIPLFYFGQLKNQVEIQKERYNEAFANYENTFLSAAEEIKNALVALQGAQKQYDAATRSLDEMSNIYVLAQRKYSAGLLNAMDFWSIETQYIQSRQSWISANAALYEGVVRFFKSIGAVS